MNVYGKLWISDENKMYYKSEREKQMFPPSLLHDASLLTFCYV